MITNEQVEQDARSLSQEVMRVIHNYQRRQTIPDKTHVLIILSALAFCAMALIRKLPRSDFRQSRDFFMDKIDQAAKDLRE